VTRPGKIALACAAVGLSVSVSSCSKSGDGAAAPPPPQVTVAQVLERRVKDWDEFTGRFQAVESVEIRPRVSGYIDEVAFKEGGQVRRGDRLFVIDPRPYKAEADHAAADVKRYKTALDLAQIELTRWQRLRDSGAVSVEELDERKSTVAAATITNRPPRSISISAAHRSRGCSRTRPSKDTGPHSATNCSIRS